MDWAPGIVGSNAQANFIAMSRPNKKKFYNLVTRAQSYKTFFMAEIIEFFYDKLECLTLPNPLYCAPGLARVTYSSSIFYNIKGKKKFYNLAPGPKVIKHFMAKIVEFL